MRLLGLVMQNSNTFKNLIQQIQMHPLIQIQVLNIYTASNSQIGCFMNHNILYLLSNMK